MGHSFLELQVLLVEQPFTLLVFLENGPAVQFFRIADGLSPFLPVVGDERSDLREGIHEKLLIGDVAVGKLHLGYLLEVGHVAVEHDGSDLLDLVGLRIQILESKMVFLLPRASVELVVGTTVLVYNLIDVLVRGVQIALVVGDNPLLHSVDDQRDFYLDDPGDIDRDGVIFPHCLAALLVVG